MSRLKRIAVPLLLAGTVIGCSGLRPESSGEPSIAATPTTVASPTPAPAPTTRPTDSPSLVGLEIDARRVIAAAGIECTGGSLAGEGDVRTRYEVWTLHCQAGPTAANEPAKLVDALRAEAERLGATNLGEFEVTSSNAGNSGDGQLTLYFEFEGVDVKIRVTTLKQDDGWSMVVTIDQLTL